MLLDLTGSIAGCEFTGCAAQAAPAGSIDELTRDDGLQFRNRTYDFYKVPRYWETRH